MGHHYRIILISLLISSVELIQKHKCLTGYMTDVQDWVDDYGRLTQQVAEESAIDLSATANPLPLLQEMVSGFRSSMGEVVKYLSLARCQLSRVPPVFHAMDSNGRFLYDMVEYVTFYGNTFLETSSPGEEYSVIFNATEARNLGVDETKEESVLVWWLELQQTRFPYLKELDLRACAIRILTRNLFIGMPNLEALYLGENNIHYVHSGTFRGLSNLVHLDFSRNIVYYDRGVIMNLKFEDFYIFEHLKKLSSLDFSFTKITQRNLGILKGLSKNMQRLSLCDADISSIPSNTFNETSMRILDVSYNKGVFDQENALNGIQETLQFLYAINVDLNSMEEFEGFIKLEVLKVSYNHIANVPKKVSETLTNLQILDMTHNSLTTWFQPTFSLLPSLKFLSVTHNNINILSEEMIEDFSEINYLAISNNFLVCNCESREFLETAAENEFYYNSTSIDILNNFKADRVTSYHTGFEDYNKQIHNRKKVEIHDVDNYDWVANYSIEGKYLLVDYSPLNYTCLSVSRSRAVSFVEVKDCQTLKIMDYEEVMQSSKIMLLSLLIIPCVMLPVLVGFIFRRNIRYCFLTMRNSALLSMMNKDKQNAASVPDGTIYHYDVFVSYCNEDRSWLLDHLLPHLETDCNVSACLHERDFQVGLSILENIVSCMDRSRAIMLIISRKFLKSQWCQFEMHLAQHRLLETRREDLTLVLLEDIPRRLRPNTLHYLMLTKTYIVWPQNESERDLFWKRLNKSFVSQKNKYKSRDSAA